jgi:3-methyl-2-oxobutanoate hydroxymethyltransferase
MVAAAKGLQEAGVFGLVLECIPDQLARIISETLSIPTIGIGAGVHCDGQVLVTHDLLGMFEKFIPSFVKTYTSLAPLIKENVTRYTEEVRKGSFPDATHSFITQVDLGELLDQKKPGA